VPAEDLVPARRAGRALACWTGGHKPFSTSRRMMAGPPCDLICHLLLFLLRLEGQSRCIGFRTDMSRTAWSRINSVGDWYNRPVWLDRDFRLGLGAGPIKP